MEKAEKRTGPPSTIRLMPKALASLFIAASVGRLSHLFPRWMSAKIEKVHDVTSSQILAIFIISQEEQVTMGQLAQMLDLTPRAITGLMAGLEKKKLVTRTKDQSDARITWLSLSEAGRRFLKNVRPDASKKLSGLFEVLTKKEQIELVRIIEKLTDHMKSQIDE
jgi:DNA-binding MarR family transcriptional regulator